MTAAPPIDDGDAPGLKQLMRLVFSPTPGRLVNTLRVVGLVLAVVTICETFRVPEIAVAAYIVLFLSRADAASTVMSALIAGIAVVLAIFVAILVFMASLAEPALRIPLIAATTFVAMFLARSAGALGPAFFAAGFIIAYGLTLGDEVLGLALMPETVADTSQFALPELVFFPPEEALLRFLLWLALAVAIPVALVSIVNLLTGRDPAIILGGAMAERLRAAGRFCEGQAGADRQLAGLVRGGTSDMLKLQHLAGLFHRSLRLPAPVRDIHRLLLLLLAFHRVGGGTERLKPVAQFCRDTAKALQDDEPISSAPDDIVLDGVARPLGEQISRTLRAIHGTDTPIPVQAGGRGKEPSRLLAADAFSNPEHVHFALKVTLAVMVCYIAQNLLDWPGIHTCIITCFFVSLATVGETVHKATLRLAGCLIGAAFGIGSILVVTPMLTDLGDLLLLLAPVTFIAGWIGFGSERIAYAGWQIALAFYLSVLQGFGPSLDMETARDRVVGILIGNVMIFVIFTTIWPVSAARLVRANLVKAVEQLAALFGAEAAAEQGAAFEQAILQARALMLIEAFETPAVRSSDGHRLIDAVTLAQVQALLIPVSVIATLRHDTAWQDVPEPARLALVTYHEALGSWLQHAASWIRGGEGAATLASSLPDPPDFDTAALPDPVADQQAVCAAWYGLLHQDIQTILVRIGPGQQPGVAAPARELRLAAG